MLETVERKEKIGNVRLDYSFYSGRDLYSDGKIEDELLKIVEEHSKEEYRGIIEKRASWPIFYHLSEFRHNIVEWLPIGPNDKVLEVGSGCGAITGALAAKAGEVTCIELSKKRSLINANRNKNCENVTIHVGNFRDLEKVLPCDYDYVMLIGVFEYAFGYMGTHSPYEDFARILKKHLKAGGRLVIALENKFGMKYYAGCREDHSGRFFDSIMGYPQGDGNARTFSQNGLCRILEAAGIEEYNFYYPYPDYKFPTTIFSDARLPQVGELYQNIRNFDRDRLMLFDEQLAFDTVIKEGMFAHYSNSYMIVTGPELERKYVKYSNDRAEKYAIRTMISEKDGEVFVEKKALHDVAREHIASIADNYSKMSQYDEENIFSLNACLTSKEEALQNGCVRLEYVNGETLEEYLDVFVKAGDKRKFLHLFEKFCKIACEQGASEHANYDLIFQNIILRDNKWIAIDYEWIFDHAIPSDIMIARAIHCYTADRKFRRQAKGWMREYCEQSYVKVLDHLKKIERYEGEFQRYVQGERLALSELRHRIGNPAFSMDYIVQRIGAGAPDVQIYRNVGEGYSEENSYFIEQYTRNGQEVEFSIPIDKDLVGLRIDPAMQPCYVSVVSVQMDGKDVLSEISTRKHNGIWLKNNRFVFATTDPHFEWKVKGLTDKTDAELIVRLKLEYVSLEVASAVCEATGLRGKMPW